MGLSSSQARLLNLTARIHQIEYKAAKLEAMKLQMANESTRVYDDYLEALDKTKIQVKTLNTDGSVTYKDITDYNEFISAGYALEFNGFVYDGTNQRFFDDDGHTYVPGEKITVTPENNAEIGCLAAISIGGGAPIFTPAEVYSVYIDGEKKYSKTDVSAGTFKPIQPFFASPVPVYNIALDFAQLCKDAFGAETAPTGRDVETVITNLINSGDVTIVSRRKDGSFAKETDVDFARYETSVSTNTGLQEVSDTVLIKKAEAKYEADMKKIDMKDRKYDTDLAALEQERNAIKQELETLKTVAKDNVERTFKLFS